MSLHGSMVNHRRAHVVGGVTLTARLGCCALQAAAKPVDAAAELPDMGIKAEGTTNEAEAVAQQQQQPSTAPDTMHLDSKPAAGAVRCPILGSTSLPAAAATLQSDLADESAAAARAPASGTTPCAAPGLPPRAPAHASMPPMASGHHERPATPQAACGGGTAACASPMSCSSPTHSNTSGGRGGAFALAAAAGSPATPKRRSSVGGGCVDVGPSLAVAEHHECRDVRRALKRTALSAAAAPRGAQLPDGFRSSPATPVSPAGCRGVSASASALLGTAPYTSMLPTTRAALSMLGGHGHGHAAAHPHVQGPAHAHGWPVHHRLQEASVAMGGHASGLSHLSPSSMRGGGGVMLLPMAGGLLGSLLEQQAAARGGSAPAVPMSVPLPAPLQHAHTAPAAALLSAARAVAGGGGDDQNCCGGPRGYMCMSMPSYGPLHAAAGQVPQGACVSLPRHM
eukprot:360685-Chlamydomonas_euryale.AAC.4